MAVAFNTDKPQQNNDSIIAQSIEKLIPTDHPEYFLIFQQAEAVVNTMLMHADGLTPEDKGLTALMVVLSHMIDDMFDKPDEMEKHMSALKNLVEIAQAIRAGDNVLDMEFVANFYQWLNRGEFSSYHSTLKLIVERVKTLAPLQQFYWCHSFAKMVLAGAVSNSARYYANTATIIKSNTKTSPPLRVRLNIPFTDIQLKLENFYRSMYLHLMEALNFLDKAEHYYWNDGVRPVQRLETALASDSSLQGLFLLVTPPDGFNYHHIAAIICVDAICGILVFLSNSDEENLKFAYQIAANKLQFDVVPTIEEYLEIMHNHWQDLARLARQFPDDEYIHSRIKLVRHTLHVFSRSARLDGSQTEAIYQRIIREGLNPDDPLFEQSNEDRVIATLLSDFITLFVPPTLYRFKPADYQQLLHKMRIFNMGKHMLKITDIILEELRKILVTHDFTLASAHFSKESVGTDNSLNRLLSARVWFRSLTPMADEADELLQIYSSRENSE
jgi:hypothetical protein